MEIKKIKFENFSDCYECSIGSNKLVICADIGPRILYLSTGASGNILFEDKKNSHTNSEWRLYGGSRLWIAPETGSSYAPDNSPCKTQLDRDRITVTQTKAGADLVKSMLITEKNGNFSIAYSAQNTGAFPVFCALWSITCALPKGTVFFPWGNNSKEWQTKKIVYWQKWLEYSTNVESSQFVPGKDLFLINPSGETGKVGTSGYGGFIGITADTYTFIKKSKRIESGVYSDDDCAIQCYTCSDFVELETLGPLQSIMPGLSTTHEEEWIVTGKKVDVSNGAEIRTLVSSIHD
jgi:hypothetical protein